MPFASNGQQGDVEGADALDPRAACRRRQSTRRATPTMNRSPSHPKQPVATQATHHDCRIRRGTFARFAPRRPKPKASPMLTTAPYLSSSVPVRRYGFHGPPPKHARGQPALVEGTGSGWRLVAPVSSAAPILRMAHAAHADTMPHDTPVCAKDVLKRWARRGFRSGARAAARRGVAAHSEAAARGGAQAARGAWRRWGTAPARTCANCSGRSESVSTRTSAPSAPLSHHTAAITALLSRYFAVQ